MHGTYLQQSIDSGLHQQQKLLMTTSMQQAILVMQLPILELSEWVKREVESNPVLEVQTQECDWEENEAFSKRKRQPIERRPSKELLENLVPAPPSLFDHLFSQAQYHFTDPNDIQLAKILIGHLDEKGFMNTPLKELSQAASEEKLHEILQGIQTFDPPGIAARSVQESLLIQLRLKNKHETAAYRIIEELFQDLLHNRLLRLSKKLHLPLNHITQAIESDIAPLDLNPADRFIAHHTFTIIPDLFFFCIDDAWKIEINHGFLPRFHLAASFREAIEKERLTPEEHSYLKRHLTSGKWIRHIVEKRKMTLWKIGEFLLKAQSAFFQEGRLIPLTMTEAAAALGLHESTIARAVANKYLSCPQGTFALRDFFNHGLRGKEGKNISHQTVRLKLKELIASEDKQKPFSDAQIKQELGKIGIPCARRTVAKYRRLLKIASACRRKRWS
jgi:RNA polymerase sigma-54 factor